MASKKSTLVAALGAMGFGFSVLLGMIVGGIMGIALGGTKGPDIIVGFLTRGRKRKLGQKRSPIIDIEEEDII